MSLAFIAEEEVTKYYKIITFNDTNMLVEEELKTFLICLETNYVCNFNK
jgi:hypothetical protein